MNSREFHRQTVFGLIQTTVNTTFLDIIRRRLIEVAPEEQVIDWDNNRTIINEINWLFRSDLESRRERRSINNIITEIHFKALPIYTTLTEVDAFDEALKKGIKSYSQYIRRNQIVPPLNFAGFWQTLSEQFNFGLLQYHQRDLQVNYQFARYLEYRHRIRIIIKQFFENNGANPTFTQRFIIAQQDCCWCLYNYKKLPLYRTVLRDYIEDIYSEARQELQRQGLEISNERLITNLENYINDRCTYLHFNLEYISTQAIRRYRIHQLQNMNQDQLRAVLTQVLGQNGLNINHTYQQMTQALAGNQARELSLVKISDFYGKDNEDPHEWIDQFDRAAAANRWNDNARKLVIAASYMKGAAAAWITTETDAEAAN